MAPDEALDPWFPWFDVFRAACERFVKQCAQQNELAETIAPYLGLVERALAQQPPRPQHLDRLLVTFPDANLCPRCGAPNGGGYVTPGCADCRDRDGHLLHLDRIAERERRLPIRPIT